jgi:large subunit ribosomal protein L15
MSMIHEITTGLPRYKKTQRKGRGESSGRGKTCGRGNKGSKARTGTTYKPTYEGGQTEIFRRFPKRGFNNVNFERKFHIVNLISLEEFDNGTIVDSALLFEKGLIPDQKQPAKILGDGTLTKKLTVSVGWYSKTALAKITEAGGTAQNVKGEAFAFPKPKKKFIKREVVKKLKEAPAEAPAAEKVAEKAAPEAAAPEAKPAE